MQYLRDMKAYQQFQQSYGNTMLTAAYGPALVTDKRPFEHATQIANAINNNLPYEFMPQGDAGRGQAEGSPGITNYNYETGEVKRPSIYSGTQAEREAYNEQQRGKIATNVAKLEGNQATSETPEPAAQEATEPRRIKDDIESLTWLTKKQKDIFYGVVQQMVALDPNYNLTRLAKILLTASDVDKENVLKVIKEQSK